MTHLADEVFCHQMDDTSTAYLDGELDVDIYMNQPTGFEDKTQPNQVVQLKMGLY